jgi:hypothetical protein
VGLFLAAGAAAAVGLIVWAKGAALRKGQAYQVGGGVGGGGAGMQGLWGQKEREGREGRHKGQACQVGERWQGKQERPTKLKTQTSLLFPPLSTC